MPHRRPPTAVTWRRAILCQTAFLVALSAAGIRPVGAASLPASAASQDPTVAYASGVAVVAGSPALVTVAFVVPPGGAVTPLSNAALTEVGAGPAIQPGSPASAATSASAHPCSSPPQPGQLRWPQFFDGTANPVVPLLYNPAGDPTGMGATALSSDAGIWSAAPGATYREAYGGTTSSTGGLGHPNVVYWPNPWPYGNPGEILGVTTTFFDRLTCDILHADVAINDAFQWSTAAAGAAPGFDLESVLLHELGHVAGLGHSPDPHAVMYSFIASGEVKRQLQQADIFAVDEVYPGSRTSVITGSHVGDISAPVGATLIVHNATVTGAIGVSPGVALDVENSKISGGLTADSTSAVRICGSTIGGAVVVNSARGFVLIGDTADDGCAPNTIAGLMLRGNTHGVDAIDNQVAGAVIADGNSGGGPDGTGPEITAGAVPGTFTTIEIPGAIATLPYGINPSGAIVGYFVDSAFNAHGFLDQGGTITTIDVPGASADGGGSYAYGISPSGAIVGEYFDSSGTSYGFLDQGGTFTTIAPPGAALGLSGGSFAGGISPSGAVVGTYGDSNGAPHGFLYQGGTFTTIDAPGADPAGATYATDISASGAIVGTYYDTGGTPHGYLDEGGTFRTIDFPGATNGTQVNGISVEPSGAIVGTYRDAGGIRHGFLDQGGTFRTIDVPGARVTGARDISPSGVVVGFAVVGGQDEGYLLTPS